jgi:hypothetical protein
VSVAAPKVYDDALENDLATPAREITTRHEVDRRSLLPLATPRDAEGKCAGDAISFNGRELVIEEVV